jgi:type II secretory pathway component GspD/PulD (secretin)
MHFAHLLRLAVWLAAALASLAAAQSALEIIPLRHRTADQVLPALRPLLEPGATLSGHGTQLIIRTSAANLDELRRALEAIDRPLRRLQISVRFDEAGYTAAQDAGIRGRVNDRGARVEIQAREGRTAAVERVDQRIQVVEGGRAYIATGQSTPVFDGGVMSETATGFEVVARLAGNTVTMEIAQRRDTANRQQALATAINAPLGEWFEVAGAAAQASSIGRQSGESRRVWLKVEEIRP